jgi:antitoxin MazE
MFCILVKWGNSIGIRIPSSIMKEAYLKPGMLLDIHVEETGVLTLTPIMNQQEDWTEKFNAIEDSHDEMLDLSNEFDKDEWIWKN